MPLYCAHLGVLLNICYIKSLNLNSNLSITIWFKLLMNIFSGRCGMTLRKQQEFERDSKYFHRLIVATWSNEANLDWLDANIHQRVATSYTSNDSHFAMQEINNDLSVIQEITQHYILGICYPFLASDERPVNHHPGYLHKCPDDGR